jgi:mitofusin
MAARPDPRFFLFVIVLLLLINSPDPQPQSFTTRSRFDQLIASEWDALGVLNTTRYGDFDPDSDKWLNVTGLRESDGFAWDLLAPVQDRAKEQARSLLGAAADPAVNGSLPDSPSIPVYRNVSGYVQGEWIRSTTGRVRHPSDFNSSADNPWSLAEYERNITGASGSIRLHISEVEGKMRTDANRSASEVVARVIIEDNTAMGNWWEFVLNGVHFPDFGGILLSTTSDKFDGIFALPYFALSEHLFTVSQGLLNSTLAETIRRQNNRPFPTWNPWSSAVDGSSEGMVLSSRCEYIIFLQVRPLGLVDHPDEPLDIEWLEHELRYPTGYPLPRRTPLSMSMVGFSPDCGFMIESKGPPSYSPAESFHLSGSKTEEFVAKARTSTMVFAASLALQLIILVKQMKETATPSTRNRVSFYAIAILALGDGFSCLALVFLHLVVGSSPLALYATAFLALFSVVFELRFLMDIWTVQATEQIRQERQQNPPANGSQGGDMSRTAESTVGAEGLPLPVTARTVDAPPLPPIIIAPDQDDPLEEDTNTTAGEPAPTTPARAELGALYTRYCVLLLFIFFLTLHSTSLWIVFRSVYFNTLCFVYLSCWCPQIYRNIMRNCRKALRWDFVFGQTAVRLVPITYFYAVSDNILFSHKDTTSLLVLVGWAWLQILVLLSQEVLGPRFFIREGWAPPAYDYHPVLHEDEEGATMPIGPAHSPEEEQGSSRRAGESKSKGKKVYDCSICAQDIEVPVIPSGTSTDSTAGLGGLILTRRAYMVTPCRHIFHTPCLEGWMRYRLQCPNCREILPPL